MDSSSSDTAVFDDFDFSDRWGMDWEDSFHANATGHLSDDEGLAHAMTTTLDNNAFVVLNTFFFVFDNTDGNSDGITSFEIWDVITELRSRNFFD